jgi:Ca2+-binding RTX toxin-like protein
MRPAAAAVLVLVPLVWTPTAADAAAPTCQGQPATVQGSQGFVQGTAGDDVIVLSGAASAVDAGAGNDLICLRGTKKILSIYPGAGDDVVDASGAGARTWTELGPGSDTITGSSFADEVIIGEHTDGVADVPGHYVVSTGTGRDTVTLNEKGAVVDARLGRGNDLFVIYTAFAGPGSTLDLGVGTDSFVVQDHWEYSDARGTALLIDLGLGIARWRDVDFALRRTENVSGYAERVEMHGSNERNRLFGHGCDVDLRGRGGDDLIYLSSDNAVDIAPALGDCQQDLRLRAYGTSGDDVLRGGKYHDVLIGGHGRDKAHGGPGGHDRCDAELVAGKGCLGS